MRTTPASREEESPLGMDAAVSPEAVAWMSGSTENPAPRVQEVLHDLVRHPVRSIFLRWNWKSALLSSILRSQIFFFANLRAGLDEAVGAMLAELAFRAFMSGFCGSLTQAFRRATPRWLATLTVMGLLPFANHTLELVLHWLRGTPDLKTSMIASISFTAISSAFNLFAMREGALITGAERRSLADDLRRIPDLLVRFFLHCARQVWRATRLIGAASAAPANFSLKSKVGLEETRAD